MNRLEMAGLIAEHVPALASKNATEWRALEKARRQFVRDYSLARIPRLTLDQYVIGKGRGNRAFCYRLERELDRLGRILGARADKFGVYFGKTKSERSDRYRYSSIWGNTIEQAFSSVKQAIVELLQAAERDDQKAIRGSKISPLFKGKLLYIYFPKKFAPVYSMRHLEHFAAELNLVGPFGDATDIQRALMEYQRTWPQLTGYSECLYMEFLYRAFGYPIEEQSIQRVTASLPLLGEALNGARIITQMPAPSLDQESRTKVRGKTNYEAHQRQLKRIGDRGEAIVIELEKKRLIVAGKRDLAKRIEHISQQNDDSGFDILSFEVDGTDRQIEVKAISGSNLDRGFYITRNELGKAEAFDNYYLYLVFSAMSKNPRVLPIKHPAFSGRDFTLSPIAFHATLPEIERTE